MCRMTPSVSVSTTAHVGVAQLLVQRGHLVAGAVDHRGHARPGARAARRASSTEGRRCSPGSSPCRLRQRAHECATASLVDIPGAASHDIQDAMCVLQRICSASWVSLLGPAMSAATDWPIAPRHNVRFRGQPPCTASLAVRADPGFPWGGEWPVSCYLGHAARAAGEAHEPTPPPVPTTQLRQASPSQPALDLVFIEGLVGENVIGIHATELHRPQPLTIDVCVGVPRAARLRHRPHRRHRGLRRAARAAAAPAGAT